MTPAGFDLLDDVRDGDLVAVRSNHGGLPALTRWVTRSPYTHTAVVIRLDGLAWVAELGAGGNVLVPLRRYSGKPIDVFDFPGDRELMRRGILDSLDGKIAYDFADLVRISLYNLVQLRLPRTDRGGMVCSSYSSWLWRGAGVMFDAPSIVSPGAFVEALRGLAALKYRSDGR